MLEGFSFHHTHPATAQLLDDAVVRNGLADHARGAAFPRVAPCCSMMAERVSRSSVSADITGDWSRSAATSQSGVIPRYSSWPANASKMRVILKISLTRGVRLTNFNLQPDVFAETIRPTIMPSPELSR